MAADNYSDVMQVLAQQIVEACMQMLRKNLQGMIAGTTISADQIDGEISNVNTNNLALEADHVIGLSSYIQNMIGGSTIDITKLLTPNGDSLVSIDEEGNIYLNNVHLNSAQVTDVFKAQYATIWEAEIGKAEIQTALVDALHANFADIAQAEIETANIDTAQITGLTAVSADIANLFTQNADIDFANIKDLNAGKAIIEQGVDGKLYVADLAVTDANMLSLTVGELIIKDKNTGKFVSLYLDPEDGTIKGQEKTVSTDELDDLAITGDKIAYNSINGETKIIESSIVARNLNVRNIFAENEMVINLMAQNANIGSLFATEAFVNTLNATNLTSNTSLTAYVESQHDDAVRRAELMLADDRIISTVTGSSEFSDTINNRTRQTVTVTYCISSSGTEPPDANADWSSTIPEATFGDFLWTKTVTEYYNGQTPSTVYHVTRYGEHSADGIIVKTTSNIGFTFDVPEGTMTLTADVYAGGTLLGQADVNALGCLQWFKNGVRVPGSQLTNWHQLTIDLATVGNNAVYSVSLMG